MYVCIVGMIFVVWLHVDETSLDFVVLGALLLDQLANKRRNDACNLHSLSTIRQFLDDVTQVSRPEPGVFRIE